MIQLRAGLGGFEPEIWRRVIVDPRLTMAQLHTVLQIAFGWTNSHLHRFSDKAGQSYGTPSRDDPDYSGRLIDERRVCVGEVFDCAGKALAYEYDFGDSWIHKITFEGRVESETATYPRESFVEAGKGVFSGKKRAAVCMGGAMCGPPEDCGGVYGYQELLELRARRAKNPNARLNAADRERLAWLGEWDTDWFDLSTANTELGKVRVKKAFARKFGFEAGHEASGPRM